MGWVRQCLLLPFELIAPTQFWIFFCNFLHHQPFAQVLRNVLGTLVFMVTVLTPCDWSQQSSGSPWGHWHSRVALLPWHLILSISSNIGRWLWSQACV